MDIWHTANRATKGPVGTNVEDLFLKAAIEHTMAGFWTQTAVAAGSSLSSAEYSEVMLVFCQHDTNVGISWKRES